MLTYHMFQFFREICIVEINCSYKHKHSISVIYKRFDVFSNRSHSSSFSFWWHSRYTVMLKNAYLNVLSFFFRKCNIMHSIEELYQVVRTTPTTAQATHHPTLKMRRYGSVYSLISVATCILPCRKYTPEHMSLRKNYVPLMPIEFFLNFCYTTLHSARVVTHNIKIEDVITSQTSVVSTLQWTWPQWVTQ